MVSGSEDGGIWLWDVTGKNVLQRIEEAHEGVVLDVDAREGLLVSCGLDGCVRVWEVEGDDEEEEKEKEEESDSKRALLDEDAMDIDTKT